MIIYPIKYHTYKVLSSSLSLSERSSSMASTSLSWSTNEGIFQSFPNDGHCLESKMRQNNTPMFRNDVGTWILGGHVKAITIVTGPEYTLANRFNYAGIQKWYREYW